jgi:glycosyltransferase involved in cell wall biosynthesis
MSNSLVPLIVMTLNNKFVPATSDGAYGFGVVGFTVAAAAALEERGRLGGLILYQRDEELTEPSVSPRSFLGHPGVEFRFNMRMPRKALRRAFACAIHSLVASATREWPRDRRPLPVVYHQTNTLLSLTPPELPFLVTHHGPFAHEVRRIFGESFAVQAFQGGQDKLTYLMTSQRHGLARLRRSHSGVAFEMSTVQAAILERYGVPSARVIRASPPVDICNGHAPGAAAPACDRSARDESVTAVSPDALYIISAAARLDAFKNLGQIIEAANRLTALDICVHVQLHVGSKDEEEARGRLIAAASSALRPRVTVTPRLPHASLVRMLTERARTSVFVCSSVYETLCITALEAALAGMHTIVPHDEGRIGITEYVPPEGRFYATTDGLVRKLIEVHRRRQTSRSSSTTQAYALKRSGPSAFRRSLDLAVRQAVSAVPGVIHAEDHEGDVHAVR